MSTFLSYSQDGALVGGFGRDPNPDHAGLFKRRRGGAWVRFANADANNPTHVSTEVVAWQQGAYEAPPATARVRLSDGRVFPYPATTIHGGGGRCVTFLDRTLRDGPTRILRGDVRTTDSQGHPASYWGAGKHAVGFDGTLIYSPRFDGVRSVVVEDASGVQLGRSDEATVLVPACIDRHAAVCYSSLKPSHVWVWDGATFTEHPIAFPSFEGHAFRGPGDRLYLLYVSGVLNRLVLHALDDPTRGWIIGAHEQGYNGVGWSDGIRIFVAWSSNAGATLASITEQQIVGNPQPWPVTPPTFRRTAHKIGIGMFDDLVGPRIIDTTETPSVNTKALLHDEQQAVPLAVSRAQAQAANVPCLRYPDRHGAVTALGHGDRSLVFCYPDEDRTPDQTVALVRADLTRLRDLGLPFDCACALYRGWNGFVYVWSEEQVLRTIDLLWDLFLEPGLTPGAIWIMTKTRAQGKDGVVAHPSFQLTLDRLKAASGDWTHFPRRPADPVPPSGFFPPLQELI